MTPRTEDTIFRIDVTATHLEGLARELCKGMGRQAHLSITPENREELAKKLWDATYDIVWAFIEENLEEN
jgi:hypothetical protein